MAQDQDPLEDEAPDPDEDTQDAETEDTADDQPDGSDWETRYKEAQKVISRQGRELAAYRQSSDDFDEEEDEEGEPDDEPTQGKAATSRLENDSWELAKSLYGEPALEAYEAAATILERAQTPADWVAAFEAYHEMRSGGGKKGKADAAPEGRRQSRDRALEPRVDDNRSEPSSDLTQSLEEARKSGSLEGFTQAAAKLFGR